jgi:hypothetical protein
MGVEPIIIIIIIMTCNSAVFFVYWEMLFFFFGFIHEVCHFVGSGPSHKDANSAAAWSFSQCTGISCAHCTQAGWST